MKTLLACLVFLALGVSSAHAVHIIVDEVIKRPRVEFTAPKPAGDPDVPSKNRGPLHPWIDLLWWIRR